MRHSFFARICAAWIALVLLLALLPSASAATSQFTDISRAAYPAYFDAINFVVDNGYMPVAEYEVTPAQTMVLFNSWDDIISTPFNK